MALREGPMLLAALSDATAVDCGEHSSAALTRSGDLYTWGR